MFKPTPNPPDTDPASPYESLDSKKFHEAAERALDHYLNPAAQIMASTHEPEPMFLANPKYDTESLLANASESLGSATTMLSNFAALLENSYPGHRQGSAGKPRFPVPPCRPPSSGSV